MKDRFLNFALGIIFVVLAFLFYSISISGGTTDEIFLTIATFLFSIFTGFFIARQGKRFSNIREIVTTFDGNLSFIYRAAGHLGNKYQESIGLIIKKHYQVILDKHSWDYHFTHKSSSITEIHKELQKSYSKSKLDSVENNAVNRSMAALLAAQIARKQMIALHQERIPKFQWLLICSFAIILVLTVSTVPSVGVVLGSVLKSAFAVSVVAVLIILHRFNNLSFFENSIGENSANDVISIIDGKK